MALVKTQFGMASEASQGHLPTPWEYYHATDNLSDVEAASYFDNLADLVTAGDHLYVKAADGSRIYAITSDTGVTPVVIDPLTAAASGVTIQFAGQVTWTGGAATLAHTVTGVLATDQVSAIWKGAPTEASSISQAVPTADTITFTATAANTSNDGVVSYVVYRT